jgi:hypothetical protein
MGAGHNAGKPQRHGLPNVPERSIEGSATLALSPSIVFGVRNAEWEFVVNPIVDIGFGKYGQADFAPAVRLARKLDRDLFVGLEYYADFGEVGRFGKASDQQHTLFAVTDFKLGVFDIDFGIGYGLTPSSDRLVVKTIIGYAFPAPGGSPDASERTPTRPVNPMSRSAARLASYQ